MRKSGGKSGGGPGTQTTGGGKTSITTTMKPVFGRKAKTNARTMGRVGR
jgi:hypothetical protein